MLLKQTRSAGEGLERLCRPFGRDWIATAGPVDGVELFRASFVNEAYRKHRHDTYAVGLTDTGVQVFDYRGGVRVSLPGQVAVLYPDEAHDGRAGTAAGFGYRIGVYGSGLVCNMLLSTGLAELCWLGAPTSWPDYHDYYLTRNWGLAQLRTSQCGGRSVDFNLANDRVADYGQFGR